MLIPPLTGVAQWLEPPSVTERLQVQFPVRAHTWVAGTIPGCGTHNLCSGWLQVHSTNQCFSLLSSLPRNNENIKCPQVRI